jgi:pimeloyl-ACP methyl ester carboxylesterase
VKKILKTLAYKTRIRSVLERNNRRIAVVAVAFFVAGVALSHRVEPGIRVESVTLAGDTPALQFLPATPGPHPVALLAHGFGGSKENLFAYGEALAAAGFLCFSVDVPGHGTSPRSYSPINATRTLEEVAHAVGPVDIFIGVSMGGSRGGQAVFDGGMKPKLFIAVGALPVLGKQAPPLLLLSGRFDENASPARLKARTDARVVMSPWSTHESEAYDPMLVRAAVEAACAAVGKTPPAAATSWLWRFAGGALATLGAFGLALCLPELLPRLAWLRGPLVAAIFIVAFVLSKSLSLDTMPHLQRVPLQIAAIAIALLVLKGAGRLHIPRWSFLALAVAVWVGHAITGADFLLFHASFPLVFHLFEGTVVGTIAACRGSRRDGDIAMAIIVGL